MNNNLKNIKFIEAVLIILVVLATVIIINAEAVNASVSSLMQETGRAALYKTAGEELHPSYLIGNIIKTFLSLLGVFFMGLTLYGGFLWMTARGDAEKVKKAMDILRDALIGLVIAIGAYAITYFILFYIARNYIQGGGGF